LVSKIYINRPQQDGGAPKPIIVVQTAPDVWHYFFDRVSLEDAVIRNDPTKHPSVWMETDQPVSGWRANDLTGSDGVRSWVELPPGTMPSTV
jgi:hypothetical protein